MLVIYHTWSIWGLAHQQQYGNGQCWLTNKRTRHRSALIDKLWSGVGLWGCPNIELMAQDMWCHHLKRSCFWIVRPFPDRSLRTTSLFICSSAGAPTLRANANMAMGHSQTCNKCVGEHPSSWTSVVIYQKTVSHFCGEKER